MLEKVNLRFKRLPKSVKTSGSRFFIMKYLPFQLILGQ